MEIKKVSLKDFEEKKLSKNHQVKILGKGVKLPIPKGPTDPPPPTGTTYNNGSTGDDGSAGVPPPAQIP